MSQNFNVDVGFNVDIKKLNNKVQTALNQLKDVKVDVDLGTEIQKLETVFSSLNKDLKGIGIEETVSKLKSLSKSYSNIQDEIKTKLKEQSAIKKEDLSLAKEAEASAKLELDQRVKSLRAIEKEISVRRRLVEVQQKQIAEEQGYAKTADFLRSSKRFSNIDKREERLIRYEGLGEIKSDLNLQNEEEKRLSKEEKALQRQLSIYQDLINKQKEKNDLEREYSNLQEELGKLTLENDETGALTDAMETRLIDLEEEVVRTQRSERALKRQLDEDLDVNAAMERVEEIRKRRNELAKSIATLDQTYNQQLNKAKIDYGAVITDPYKIAKERESVDAILASIDSASPEYAAYKKVSDMEALKGPNNEEMAQIVSLNEEIKSLESAYKSLRTTRQEESAQTSRINSIMSKNNSLYMESNKVLNEQIKNSKDIQAILERRMPLLSEGQSYLKNYISGMVILASVAGTIRSATKYVIEFNDALNQIAIVSNRTMKSASELRSEYVQMAKDLSLSTVEVAKAAVIFFQQGRTASEVSDLVRSTAVAAGLAGISVEEAASRMTAALNSYQLAASEAMRVTDKFSKLASTTASDFEELTSAFSRVAAQANLAKVDMDLMLGILSSNIETLREAPESIGTAWKTIIARMRQITSANFMEGMVDAEGEALSLNKVEDALRSAGVALRDLDTGLFRDLDDVLMELGERWSTLDTNTKAYLATTVSGQRQQSRFVAAMDNWDSVMENFTTSQNSAGSAVEQYNKKLQSLSSSLQKLRATIEEFFSKIVNVEIFKDLISVFTKFIDVISAGNSTAVVLKTMGVALAGVAIAINRFDQKKMDDIASKLREIEPEKYSSVGLVKPSMDDPNYQLKRDQYYTELADRKRLAEMKAKEIIDEEKLVKLRMKNRAIMEKMNYSSRQRLNLNKEANFQLNKSNSLSTKAMLKLKSSLLYTKLQNVSLKIKNKIIKESTALQAQQLVNTKASFNLLLKNIALTTQRIRLLKFSLVDVRATMASLAATAASIGAVFFEVLVPIIAISLALKGVIKLIDIITGKSKMEKIQKNFEELSESVSKTRENLDKYKELVEIYDELISKEILSNEERSRLSETTYQLSQIVSGLTISMDENKKSMIQNIDVLKEYEKAQQKIINSKELEKNLVGIERAFADLGQKEGIKDLLGFGKGFSEKYREDGTAREEIEAYIQATNISAARAKGIDINSQVGRAIAKQMDDALREYIDNLIEEAAILDKGNVPSAGMVIKNLDSDKLQEIIDQSYEESSEILTNPVIQRTLSELEELKLKARDGSYSLEELTSTWRLLGQTLRGAGLEEGAISSLIGEDFYQFYEGTLPVFSQYADTLSKVAAAAQSTKDKTMSLVSAREELTSTGKIELGTLSEIAEEYSEITDYLEDTNDLTLENGKLLDDIIEKEKIRSLLKAQEAVETAKANKALLTTRYQQAEERTSEINSKPRTLVTEQDKLDLAADAKIISSYQSASKSAQIAIDNAEVALEIARQTYDENEMLIEIETKRFENQKDKYMQLMEIKESLSESTAITPDIAQAISEDFPELIYYLTDAELLLEKITSTEEDYRLSAQKSYQKMMAQRAKNDTQHYEDAKVRLREFLEVEMTNLGILTEAESNEYSKMLDDYEDFNEAKLAIANKINGEILSSNAKMIYESMGQDYQASIDSLNKRIQGAKSINEAMYNEALRDELLEAQKKQEDLLEGFENTWTEGFQMPDLDFSKDDKNDQENIVKGYELIINAIDTEIELIQKRREYIKEGSDEYKKSLQQENGLIRQRLSLMNIEAERLKASYSGNTQMMRALKEVQDFMSNPNNKISFIEDVTYFGEAAKLSQDQLSSFNDYLSILKEIEETTQTRNQNSIKWFSTTIEGNKTEISLLESKVSLLTKVSEKYSFNSKIVDSSFKQVSKALKEERKLLVENKKIYEEILNNTSLNLTAEQLNEFESALVSIKTELNDVEKITKLINSEIDVLLSSFTRVESSLSKVMELLSLSSPEKRIGTLVGRLENSKGGLVELEKVIGRISKGLGKGTEEEQLESFLKYEQYMKRYQEELLNFGKIYSEIDTERENVIVSYSEDLESVRSKLTSLEQVYQNLENVSLENRLDIINKKFMEQEKILTLEKHAFEELIKITPKTASEQEKLTETLDELNQSIYESSMNLKDLEQQFEIEKLNYITSEYEKISERMNKQLTITSNNLELLKTGYRNLDELAISLDALNADVTFDSYFSDKILMEEQDRASKIDEIREDSVENQIEIEIAKYEEIAKLGVESAKNNIQTTIKGLELGASVTAEMLQSVSELFLDSNNSLSNGILSIWQNMLNGLKAISTEAISLANQMGVKTGSAKGGVVAEIWDKEGRKSFGIIKDGKTFLSNGERLPEGYTVKSQSGKYYEMTSNGGVQVEKPPRFSGEQIDYSNLDFSRIDLSSLEKNLNLSSGLDFSSLEISNVNIGKNISKEIQMRIEEFEASKSYTDKLIEEAQQTIIEANRLGLDSTKETEKLLSYIEEQVAKDNEFILEIQKEILSSQLDSATKAEEEQRKIFESAKLNGTLTEEMRLSYMDSIIAKQEIQLELENTISQIYEEKARRQEEIISKHQDQINILNAEKKIVDAIYDKESETSINYSKSVLEQKNMQLRAAEEYYDRLLSEQGMLEVGSSEWNALSEEIKKARLDLLGYKSEMIELAKEIKELELENQIESFERSLLGGQTLEEYKKERDRYITGREKELTTENLLRQINQDSLNISSKHLEILKNSSKIKRSDIEIIQKEIELQRQQIRLDEIRDNKTVQRLKRDQFGNWNFEYVADEEAVSEAERQVSQVELEIEKMLEEKSLENIENYLSDIREVISESFSGEYESLSEINKVLNSIDNSIGSSLSESILFQFNDYFTAIKQILETSKALSLPDFNSLFDRNEIDNITTITVENVNFDNVTNAKEIEDSILGLEQAAKQIEGKG